MYLLREAHHSLPVLRTPDSSSALGWGGSTFKSKTTSKKHRDRKYTALWPDHEKETL